MGHPGWQAAQRHGIASKTHQKFGVPSGLRSGPWTWETWALLGILSWTLPPGHGCWTAGGDRQVADEICVLEWNPVLDVNAVPSGSTAIWAQRLAGNHTWGSCWEQP